jgi:hypothetical protein
MSCASEPFQTHLKMSCTTLHDAAASPETVGEQKSDTSTNLSRVVVVPLPDCPRNSLA